MQAVKADLKRRKRPDPRRDATRLAIIEAAESLFAKQGVDAVSVRQIGAAIGAGNTAVVSYHFGDKEALIETILLYRLPAFEERRAELSRDFEESEPDTATVLRAIWLPLFEQRNKQGKRSYAAFLASLGRSQWGWVWFGAQSNVPVTLKLGETLKALMPPSARPLFMERAIACTALVTTTLGIIDQRSKLSAQGQQALFDDAIRMAAAAFAAPGP